MAATDDDNSKDLLARYGPSARPDRPVARTRPSGASDETVEALGKLSEALEVVENARGYLYAFHRLSGMADLTLQEAVDKLRFAGHSELADTITEILVGRDVVSGRWTFELVDDYDANYWEVFRAIDKHARTTTGVTDKHVFEAEMKKDEQS